MLKNLLLELRNEGSFNYNDLMINVICTATMANYSMNNSKLTVY